METPLADQLLDRTRFILPLAFESDHDEFPVFSGGTAFIVKFREEFFAITARHSAEQGRGKAVLLYPHASERIPLLREHDIATSNAASEDDTLWTDVFCYTTYKTDFWDDVDSRHYLDLTEYKRGLEPFPFLYCAGYPHEATEFQEPNRILREPRVVIGGYGGPAESERCHLLMRLNNHCVDPQGLSGSPVFSARPTSPTQFDIHLEGMALQGAASSVWIRFVDGDTIFRMVRQLARTD